MNKLLNLKTLSETTGIARRREVENALLTQALCGRAVSPAARARLARYEAGELSREVAFADLYQVAN